jgi:hypothetical protein
VSNQSRAERRRAARAEAKTSWCHHGTLAELEQELVLLGASDWTCAAEVLHDSPSCNATPEQAIVMVTQIEDDELHVLVLPLCNSHHEPGIEYAAVHSVMDSSMSYPWSARSEILQAIHGGPQPLCRAASMTFAVARS